MPSRIATGECDDAKCRAYNIGVYNRIRLVRRFLYAENVNNVAARHTHFGLSADELPGLQHGHLRGAPFGDSHSGRVGFCVTATEAGVPAQHIAAVVRHRGLAMTSKQARMLVCATHARKGVGV